MSDSIIKLKNDYDKFIRISQKRYYPDQIEKLRIPAIEKARSTTSNSEVKRLRKLLNDKIWLRLIMGYQRDYKTIWQEIAPKMGRKYKMLEALEEGTKCYNELVRGKKKWGIQRCVTALILGGKTIKGNIDLKEEYKRNRGMNIETPRPKAKHKPVARKSRSG